MKRLRATGPDVIRVALLLAAVSSVQATQSGPEQTGNTKSSPSMERREGLSRPGAGPNRNGGSIRRLPDNPTPCGPRQIHLFVNRPCVPHNSGDDTDTNTDQTGSKDPGNNHTGNNNGGPVIVLGGTPYHLDKDDHSGDDSPNPGGNPPPHTDTRMPDHFAATPEPTYMVVTGLAFAAVWVLGRKRRTA